jgi:arginase
VITLLGVPTNSSGTLDGVALGPSALREAGLAEALARVGPFVDRGDVVVGPPSTDRSPAGIIDEANLAATIGRTRAAVRSALEDGGRPIVVGGDCPILIGAMGACSETAPEPGLVFVDGHEDAWPPAASTTGEAADMELGLLLGRHADSLGAALRAELPVLDPAWVVALGPRDHMEIATAGIVPIDDLVTVLDDAAVRRDPGGVGAAAARQARAGPTSRWWLHVDLDVLSTDALPAVDYRQAGGLDWADLEAVVDTALELSGCLGATITIYNPDLDPDRRHAHRIVDFVARLAGALGAT